MAQKSKHTSPATLRLATLQDAPSIREIYGRYIDTPITFEETLPSAEAFTQRVADVLTTYPYMVAEQNGCVIGYAYAHEQAQRAAYRWNAELSIYLLPGYGRKGLGTVLYQTLLNLLKLQGMRRAYARVTMPNAASKRLHAKLGFKEEWMQKKAGWKQGKWRDVAWLCKTLAPQSEAGEESPAEVIAFPRVDAASVSAVIEEANERLAQIFRKPVVSATTRKCMQGNKGKDTKPEQVVRHLLRDMGFPGYRLQWKQCPGRPDIAYPGKKVAIFVHGCFWHRCPTCNLPKPSSNVEYWEAKFARNVQRDARTRAALESEGWTVVTIWEHQLEKTQLEDTKRYLYEVISLAE